MRRVRCYDNGGLTADRYTVVWIKPYLHLGIKYWAVASMSEDPYHPQGVWGITDHFRELPEYGDELGKRIPFSALPVACQRAVIQYGED